MTVEGGKPILEAASEKPRRGRPKRWTIADVWATGILARGRSVGLRQGRERAAAARALELLMDNGMTATYPWLFQDGPPEVYRVSVLAGLGRLLEAGFPEAELLRCFEFVGNGEHSVKVCVRFLRQVARAFDEELQRHRS
jgi:hypothetical protein